MEIENNTKAIRAAIRKAKTVYVMNPLTEGYVRIYKNDILMDIEECQADTQIGDGTYIRFGPGNDSTSLYIN